jgi:sulfate/thiosulfate transport system ATP-binding protein
VSVEVRGITKRFGAFTALDDVSLRIPTGELVTVLGPSGSGKTTLLRIIAGLEVADGGSVHFHGEDATELGARDRQVGFVFQHYALFRHMTVFENVAFGLRVRPRRQRPSEAEIRARVAELLELVQLERLASRYPSQLSGGQRQRVALARALAIEPKVLLLDEPFGALDARVRQELRRWLRRLHDDLRITGVLVTHDREEALEVADRVVVMNHGRVEQVGTPEDVYDDPVNPFVFDFLGSVNLFHGRVEDGRLRIGAVVVEAAGQGGAGDAPVVGYARPHDVVLERLPGAGCIEAVVRHIQPAGPLVRVQLTRSDTSDPIQADLSRERYRELELKAGERMFVTPRNLRVFASGARALSEVPG